MKPILSFSLFVVLSLGISGCRLRNTPPELISLSLKQAFVGQEITLTGHQFGSAPVVLFGVASSVMSASISSHNENTITVKVPYIAPGITQIRVQTDQGTTDPLPFIAQQPGPQVVAISPTNGLPGTAVVITGDFLNLIKRIRFADVDAVIKDSSAQKLTILIPPNAPRGPQALAIETQGGLFTSSFIVAGTPQITAMSPLKTKPGAPLTIKGINLLDGVVRVNGKFTEKSLTTVTDTEIRTVIPAEATSGVVTVTVFDKLVAISRDTLQIFQQPVVARLSAQDAVAGEKLIIDGRNLGAVTSLSVGSVAASFRVLSDTQLEATVPTLPSSGPVTVSVSSLGGNASGAAPLFVFLAPSAVVVTPARQLPGRFVTISGKNFYRITEVRFNGLVIPVVSRNEGTDLYISLPSNAVSAPVTITNRAGSAVSAVPLVIVQKPIVSDLLPAKASVGQRVVIRGDFLLNAQIFFTGSTKAAVDDGKNTDTERWVLVPADAKTGPLRVINETNDPTNTIPFTVLP